jgi:hypothetical protein
MLDKLPLILWARIEYPYTGELSLSTRISLTAPSHFQKHFGLSSTLYTSTGQTTIGSFYMHGDWIPAVIAMFRLGCGVRVIEGREAPQ